MAEKKLTNADRIRSMSDEELAEVIDITEICVHRTISECRETYGSKCESCIRDWLKQGVE